MFSANENIALRQEKRRVVSMIESTIPESALDAGTSVMAMQVSCRAPGCVPLETAIAVVFPRPLKSSRASRRAGAGPAAGGGPPPEVDGDAEPLMEGLPESAVGGTFKTTILLPMAQITTDDVLDALPPAFIGGRRTMEMLCLRARDVMLNQIEKVVGRDDVDGKRLVVEYLVGALGEYVERGCVAPEIGEPFPPLTNPPEEVGEGAANGGDVATDAEAAAVKGKDGNDGNDGNDSSSKEKEDDAPDATTKEEVRRGMRGSGNFVIRRAPDEDGDKDNGGAVEGSAKQSSVASARLKSKANTSSSSAGPPGGAGGGSGKTTITKTQSEWRQMQRGLNVASSSSASRNAIQRLAEREHAPGVRRPGCPCCDPDDPANVVDSMMML